MCVVNCGLPFFFFVVFIKGSTTRVLWDFRGYSSDFQEAILGGESNDAMSREILGGDTVGIKHWLKTKDQVSTERIPSIKEAREPKESLSYF